MKTITLTALYLVIGIFSFAQATTETEYKFATVGYLRVLNEGDDMKEGYTTRRVYSGNTTEGSAFSSSYKFDAEALLLGTELRAIMIIFTQAGKAKAVYCMPLYDSPMSMWKSFIDQTDKIPSGSQRRAFTQATTRAWAWMLKK